MILQINPTNLAFRSTPVDRPATNRVVVHHSASSESQSVESIHAFHKTAKGWNGIGYNIIQTADGQWHEGRGLDKVGAHATSFNSNSVGICLIGHFEHDEVPPGRWESLVDMCAFLLGKYSLTYTDVVGHNELPGAATACPGINMKALRGELEPAGRIVDAIDEIIDRLGDLRRRIVE